MNELKAKYDSITTKEDFISFVELLIEDLRINPNEWENKTLESYLEAIVSSTEDLEGYYLNNNLPIPQHVNWKLFANILATAKMYE
jgi:hypothetical protein